MVHSRGQQPFRLKLEESKKIVLSLVFSLAAIVLLSIIILLIISK